MAIPNALPADAPAGGPATVLRPPLKWAGGKRWQVPHLRPLWESHRHRRLVEPFCGGLAVTLGLMPERALLADVNPHLVNFYRWLQRGLEVNLPLDNNSKLYYAYRDRFNGLLTAGAGESAEAAILFYYLNRTGYNGLCRFNSKGAFNVPFGRYKNIEYKTDFHEYQALLSRFAFVHADFEQLAVEPEDFIYADPPYDVPFTQYSQGGFGWPEQERAAGWVAKHCGPVVLVNQATDRINALYRDLGFKLDYWPAPRLISCTGDRTPVIEVIATLNV